jgi:hypothetical protein
VQVYQEGAGVAPEVDADLIKFICEKNELQSEWVEVTSINVSSITEKKAVTKDINDQNKATEPKTGGKRSKDIYDKDDKIDKNDKNDKNDKKGGKRRLQGASKGKDKDASKGKGSSKGNTEKPPEELGFLKVAYTATVPWPQKELFLNLEVLTTQLPTWMADLQPEKLDAEVVVLEAESESDSEVVVSEEGGGIAEPVVIFLIVLVLVGALCAALLVCR